MIYLETMKHARANSLTTSSSDILWLSDRLVAVFALTNKLSKSHPRTLFFSPAFSDVAALLLLSNW
jgi:hypothetical protein